MITYKREKLYNILFVKLHLVTNMAAYCLTFFFTNGQVLSAKKLKVNKLSLIN